MVLLNVPTARAVLGKIAFRCAAPLSVVFMFLCFMWNLLEQVSLEKEINDLNGIHLDK